MSAREREGWLRRADLGTGVYVLETEAGERIELRGAVDTRLLDRRVRLRGAPVEEPGFAMLGETWRVESMQALDPLRGC